MSVIHDLHGLSMNGESNEAPFPVPEGGVHGDRGSVTSLTSATDPCPSPSPGGSSGCARHARPANQTQRPVARPRLQNPPSSVQLTSRVPQGNLIGGPAITTTNPLSRRRSRRMLRAAPSSASEVGVPA